MALIRGSSLVGAISGAIGGVVMSASRWGPIARHRPKRPASRTTATSAARGAPSRIAYAWQSLTQAQRDAWQTLAQTISVTNRLGVQHPSNGWALFWRYCAIRYNGAPPSGVVAPTGTAPVAPEYLAIHALADGPYAVTSWGYPYPTSSIAETLYLARMGYPNQLGAFKRPRRIAHQTKSLPNYDLYSAAAALNIDLLDAERIGLALRWQLDTGLPSTKYHAAALVGSTPWSIDDFESTSFNPYTGDTSDYSFDVTTVYAGTSSLKAHIDAVPQTSKILRSLQGLDAYPLQGHKFHIRAYLGSNVNDLRLIFGHTNTSNEYRARIRKSINRIELTRVLSGGTTQVALSGTATIPLGEWLRLEILWRYTNSLTLNLYNAADSLILTCTGSDSTWQKGGIGYTLVNDTGLAADAYLDQFEITGKAD